MKSVVSFLFASLLLGSVSAAFAADLPAAAPAPETAAASAPAASSSGCQASKAVAPLYNDALTQVQGPLGKCGDCSEPICVGLDRGYVCVVGGPNGFTGRCDIFSGAPRCGPSGFDCQCGTGPLP